MLNKLKQKIKNNNKLYNLFQILIMIKKSKIIKENGLKKKYPKVIQLPITQYCNAKCIMCNIPEMNCENEIGHDELERILKDPIFKEVESVGVNGGEPFLKFNIEKYIKAILKLPKLKSINIISNGFATTIILSKLELIYKLCKEKDVKFHISFSLDGVGRIHDTIRGVPGVFKKVIKTIDEIFENKNKYCDSIDLGCTISKKNLDYLSELEKFSDIKNYNIKYRLAISNARIESEEKIKEFSIFEDVRDKQTAKEFFQKQFYKSKKINEKYKYWSIYMFLSEKNPKRYLGCTWKENGITLDSQGEIYYCAVKSKRLGNLRSKINGEKIFFSNDNLNYRSEILNEECENCIHDYSGGVDFKNIIKFVLYCLKNKFWINSYKRR
ncbi:radical SAM protein [uncultured Ilyobacter sp.]|uniref:radical SAM protein n=1 Tax=uncultured Ilyobacter sp. TaxID=544433 RepID=UPI0029F49885|nr:radical SAM protein [uncultured Ilyobacter sp.]